MIEMFPVHFRFVLLCALRIREYPVRLYPTPLPVILEQNLAMLFDTFLKSCDSENVNMPDPYTRREYVVNQMFSDSLVRNSLTKTPQPRHRFWRVYSREKVRVGNGYQSQPEKDRLLPQSQGHDQRFMAY